MSETSTSTALRARYEATPRTIDDALHPLSRGDRGCLGDALAGIGALLTGVFGIIASTGAGGWGYMAIGAALFVGGFAMSTIHQSRSSAQRNQALIGGPLVTGRVLRADPKLAEPGIGFAPAIVLLSLEPERRFDPGHLKAVAERVLAAGGEVGALVTAEHIEGVPAIPEAVAEAPAIHVGEVIVDRERLSGRPLRAGGEVTLIVDPASGFIEHIG